MATGKGDQQEIDVARASRPVSVTADLALPTGLSVEVDTIDDADDSGVDR